MDAKEKQKEINRLFIYALDLAFKATKVALKPRSKYKRTNDRRMHKIISYTVQVAMTRNQILMLRSQHNFQKGGVVGIKESGNETIKL